MAAIDVAKAVSPGPSSVIDRRVVQDTKRLVHAVTGNKRLALRPGALAFDTRERGWSRYLFASGTFEPLDWPSSNTLPTILPDGRVFFPIDGTAWLADAEDGSFTKIEGEAPPFAYGPMRLKPYDLECTDYLLFGSERGTWILRDSPPRLRRIHTRGMFESVFCALDDEGTLLLQDSRGLEVLPPGEREPIPFRDWRPSR